jgi:hypothetical protein
MAQAFLHFREGHAERAQPFNRWLPGMEPIVALGEGSGSH